MGFLDEDRFNAVLPVLLAVLEAPTGAPEGSDASRLQQEQDAALVDCLVAMARAAGLDTLWRPLNRGVLMATRAEAVRPRRLGLAVVEGLVEALSEEYLVLLPEAIPFLAELCEDPDEGVEAAARRLVKRLSELSGEDLHAAMTA